MKQNLSPPSAFWFFLIPGLVAGLLPVLTNFFPPATIWWSAALVSIGGVLIGAFRVWEEHSKRQQTTSVPPGVQADMTMTPAPERPGYLKVFLFGSGPK